MSGTDIFTMISGIGDSFGKSYDAAKKDALASDLGDKVQAGDLPGAAQVAFKGGDLNTGLALMKLGQGQGANKQLADLLGRAYGGTVPFDDMTSGYRRGDAGAGASGAGGGGTPALPSFASTGGAMGDYLTQTRARESGGNDAAANPNSTALGRYQFTADTWRGLMRDHPELNLTANGRLDPDQQERAMVQFTANNAKVLGASGIPINTASLYGAHFLGAGGAARLIPAAINTPDEPPTRPPGFTGFAPQDTPTGTPTAVLDLAAMAALADAGAGVGASLAGMGRRTADLFGRIRSGEVDGGQFAKAVGGRAVGAARDVAMAGPDFVRDFLAGRIDPGSEEAAGGALGAAASAMTGSMPFSAPSGALRTFGGRAAVTADHAALDRAAAMQAAGTAPDAIWRGTGWGLGRDGVARFEIPDDAARLRPFDGTADTTLKRVLDHPALFEAYPRMRDVSVHHRPELGADAAANPARNWIALNLADPQALDALLHEGQHIVQRTEGFAPGASPVDPALAAHPKVAEVAALRQRLAGLDAPQAVALADRADQAARFAAYRTAAGEVEARNVEARRAMTPAERAAVPPWATQDVAGDAQWLPQGYGDRVTGDAAALRSTGPGRPSWPILEEIAAAHAARTPGT